MHDGICYNLAMNPTTGKYSAFLAPLISLAFYDGLVVLWSLIEPNTLIALFDNDGHSPVELMTLPLFALIAPLVWLCPPAGGSTKRQCLWASIWSLLAAMAIIRQTDLHKLLFANIWPDIASTFHGTVYKMRFLKDGAYPMAPKLFVLGFFGLFFAAVAIPLVRYIIPLAKGFFKRQTVAWTMATFGAVSVAVIIIDRVPAKLRKAGIDVSDSMIALMKVFEEGGEMLMALLALLAILQSHMLFARRSAD